MVQLREENCQLKEEWAGMMVRRAKKQVLAVIFGEEGEGGWYDCGKRTVV